MADATIVQGASGTPLRALLSDRHGPLDLSVPSAITVRIRHRVTDTTVEGTCTVVDWPDVLADGTRPKCASYDWAAGGNETAGLIEVEWHLTYAGEIVVVPEAAPLVLRVRPQLAIPA